VSKQKPGLIDCYLDELLSYAVTPDSEEVESTVKGKVPHPPELDSRQLRSGTKQEPQRALKQEPQPGKTQKTQPAPTSEPKPLHNPRPNVSEPKGYPAVKESLQRQERTQTFDDAEAAARKKMLQALLSPNLSNISEPGPEKTVKEIQSAPEVETLSDIKEISNNGISGDTPSKIEAPEPAEIIPVWQQQVFDAIVLDSGGLKFAVPMVNLGNIYNLDPSLSKMPGQEKSVLGLQKTPSGTVKAVNALLLLAPELYAQAPFEELNFLVTFNCCDWGLAVKSVGQPSEFKREDVAWPKKPSRKPWLKGILKTEMCALVDVSELEGELGVGGFTESHTPV